MSFLNSVYNFFYSFFEILSFRTKPTYEKVENNLDDEYEFVIFNNNIIKR